jgi:hypothetical protein
MKRMVLITGIAIILGLGASNSPIYAILIPYDNYIHDTETDFVLVQGFRPFFFTNLRSTEGINR